MQATGTLPPVNLAVQVNDPALDLPEVMGVLYLVVDRDGDGSFSDEAAQRMTPIGNGFYTISNVNLGNGMHFTFATASSGVRGEVFQDTNTNGVHDTSEPGLAGVTVKVVDEAGVVTSTVTDAEGKYVFLNSELAGNTRLTFNLPADNGQSLTAAAASFLDNLDTTVLGSNSRTSVQFIYVGDGWTIATAGFTLKDRPSPCTNPTVATICYENGAGSTRAGWLSFPFNTGPDQYKTDAPSSAMGAVWGSAYDSKKGQLYTAALLKRHVGLGPLAAYNGTDTYTVDGVYVVQYSGSTGSFNPSTPGFKLQGVSGIDLGTVKRHPDTNEKLDNDYEIMAKSVSKDVDAFNKAGTVGFGNADFYAGNLWLVNVNQRALIKVTTAGLPLNGSPAPAANVTQYNITNPGCSNGDFRPWALTFYNGLGYVGVVCTAETSQVRSDLHAYILSFDSSNVGAGFTKVLDFPLNFKREPASWGGFAGWQPWARNPADIKKPLRARVSYPQPILADIDFTATGDMVIGFVDRFGLQTTVFDPNPVTGAKYTAETAGDLLHACATGSNTWAIEGDLGCGGYTKLGGLNKLTDDGPFGTGEFFGSDTHMVCHGGDLHFEDLTGSTCVVGNTVLATRYGTFSEGGLLYTPALLKLNATNGGYQNVNMVPGSLPCNYQYLNNAIGELTCMCPALPVEIGNRVWNDYNHNGLQDPGEPPIAGLMVELINGGGSVIGSAITNGRGEYYFSSAPGASTSNAKYGLLIPGAGVSVRIPSASGGSQQTPLAGLILTTPNQGTDDRLDSDATPSGNNAVIAVDTSGGRIDHTYDFGFAPNIWDIALRKTVPVQYAAPGDNVTFSIEVFNQIGGPMNNITLIDYVPANLVVNDAKWTPSTLTGPGTITRTLKAGVELPAGGLLPGKSVVVNVTMQVANGVANNTVITNTAEVAKVIDINGQPFTDRDSTPDTSKTNDKVVDDMIDNTGGDEDDHDVAVVIVTAQTDIYDLALRKTTISGAIAPVVSEGDDVPFTVEVFNQGTMPARSMQLVDRYPTGFTLSPNETGWTDQGNGTATRSLTGLLAPGASTKVTIILRAGSTLGALKNYAEIKQDDGDDVDSQPEDDELDGNGDPLIDDIISDNGTNDEDDHDVAPVTVRRFDLALRKQLAAGEANPTAKGADVTFTIDVFNQGSVNAYDIMVVDYLSKTLTLSENDANGWVAGNANQVLNTIPGPLAPGTSTRLYITLHVSDTVPLGVMKNYAEIVQASDTAAGPPTADADSTPDDANGNDVLVDDVIDNSGNDEDDQDVASITIGRFDLALTKVYKSDEGNRASGGNKTDAVIGVGERVTFTLSVFNQGTVDAYDIKVTDNSPRGFIIDDSNPVYNILKGWQVQSDQIGNYVFPGPLKPGQSASIDVVIYVVGPGHPFYPPSGLTGVRTVWGEISAASYKTGGPTVVDEDSKPDQDYTNDPGGQPGSPADNYVNGNGTGTPGNGVAATDEDDEDPAQITVIPSFDLAIIKYPLVNTIGGDAIPQVQPGQVLTYEYRIVNQSIQAAQDVTLTEHVPAGLILNDANWMPSTVVGPGEATRSHRNLNLAAGAVYTNTVRFQVNPAIAVSMVYTNVIEISGNDGPSGTPVTDMDSIPNTNGDKDQPVVKDDFLTDNYLTDPASFDEDDNDIGLLQAVIEDWGDNPDQGPGRTNGDYGTLLADNGPRHSVVAGLHLGELVDGELDGLPTVNADGDNTDNRNDEDGVNVTDLNLVEGVDATVRVTATNTTSTPAYIYGFIDFNANGAFTDPGEAISVTVPSSTINGHFTLDFGSVPINGVTKTYARFRLSTDLGLTAQGVASDGEVEDYPVNIELAPVRFGDRVWLENDGDGRANTGANTPLAGMLITATSSSRAVYTATTTSQGYYSFTVPADTYIVTYGNVPASYGVTAPSKVVGGASESGNAGVYQEGLNPDVNHAQNTVVTLAPGQANWHVDFAFFTPVKIGNRLWFESDSDGDATTGDVAPVVNHLVTVRSSSGVVYTTTTDNNGLYLVPVPPNATYTVTTDTPAGATPSVFSGMPGDDQSHNPSGTVVNLGTTDNLAIDFGFHAPFARFGDRVWLEADKDGLASTGVITPVAGIVITATDANGAPYTANTNNAGYYSFTLPVGTYSVTYGRVPASYGATEPSSTPGGSSENGNAGSYKENGNPDQSHANGTTVTVGNGEANWHVDFAFHNVAPEVSIGNQVWQDGNDNGLYDTGEKVIPNLVMELWKDLDHDGVAEPQGDDAAQVPLTTTTTASGAYSFTHLAPGDYFVRIPQPPPAIPLSSLPVDAPDNGVDNDDNGSQSGGPTTQILSPVIHLAVNDEPGTNGGGLYDYTVDFGLVDPFVGNLVWHDTNNNGKVDVGEAGIPNVTVYLLYDADNNGTINGAETTPYRITQTDANGLYAFGDVAPGNYQVVIPDSNFAAGQPLAVYSKSSDVTDSADDQIDEDDNGVQASIGMTVTGPIVNLEVDQEPINAGTETGRGNTLDDADDNNGDMTIDFGFYAPVQFGDRVWIEADTDGLASTGVITPVAGINITATNGATSYVATTNSQGYYSFTLPPGTYTVRYGSVPASYGETTPSSTPGGNRETGNAGSYQQSGNPDQGHADATTVSLAAGQANWSLDFAFHAPQSDLRLIKQADKAATQSGDIVVYTLVLTNNGPDTATTVKVKDLLPTNVIYLSDAPQQGTYDSVTGVWDVGTVPANSSVTMTIMVTVK